VAQVLRRLCQWRLSSRAGQASVERHYRRRANRSSSPDDPYRSTGRWRRCCAGCASGAFRHGWPGLSGTPLFGGGLTVVPPPMILTGAPVGGAGVAPVCLALAVAPVEPDFIGMATTGVPGDPVVAAVPTRAGVPVEGADALLRVVPVV